MGKIDTFFDNLWSSLVKWIKRLWLIALMIVILWKGDAFIDWLTRISIKVASGFSKTDTATDSLQNEIKRLQKKVGK